MRCPHCEHEFEESGESCPDCGLILGAVVQCQHHPESRAKARCAVCGTAVCESCVEEHAHRYFCPAHAAAEVLDGHVVLTQVGDPVGAELLKGMLENEGISAWVHDQHAQSFGVYFGALSPVKVLVPRADLARAKELVAQQQGDVEALASGCPHCEVPLADDAQECPACGAKLD